VDVSDLYEHEAIRPSGIQRVQIGVIEALVQGVVDKHPLALVRYDVERCEWVQLSTLEFMELSKALCTPEYSKRAALSATAREDAPTFLFPKGARYLLLGTAWDNPAFEIEMIRLRKEYDIKVSCLIHDVIPVVAPQYCADGISERFARWLAAAASVSDKLLTSSESTKFELQAYCKRAAMELPPIYSTKFDVGFEQRDVGFEQRGGSQVECAGSDLAGQLGFDPDEEPFVLCVGSIEPRKNHAKLFSSWLSLERSGAVEVPHLVCAGRIGWLPQEARSHMEAQVSASTRIAIVDGLDDIALSYLYKKCVFTIYPSLHEGWGLPVSESLSFGKVPVIGSHTSLVEAGGEFAEYVDVSSADALTEKIRAILTDRTAIEGIERKIREKYSGRTWRSVAADILRIVD
jgi:glycosyltransferase involved in cell wall biosynthesis